MTFLSESSKGGQSSTSYMESDHMQRDCWMSCQRPRSLGPIKRSGHYHTLHYLDDFLVLRAGGSQQRTDALQTFLRMCTTLGVPIANHKVKGTGTVLPFLGTQIDTVQCIMKLLPDEFLCQKQTIQQWQGKKICKKHDSCP